jgi:hypothetical protein
VSTAGQPLPQPDPSSEPRAKSRKDAAASLAVIGVIIGILAALHLTDKISIDAGLIIAGILAWPIILHMLNGEFKASERTSMRWSAILLTIGLMTSGVVVAIGATQLAHPQANNLTPVRTVLPSPSKITPSPSPSLSSNATSAANIKFLEPRQGQQVPQCPKIVGSGTIPPGDSLWIMVVPNVDKNPSDYWFGNLAISDGADGWHAKSVSVASAGDTFHARLYAILLDERWGEYLKRIGFDSNQDVNELPPALATYGPVDITRTAESNVGGTTLSCKTN